MKRPQPARPPGYDAPVPLKAPRVVLLLRGATVRPETVLRLDALLSLKGQACPGDPYPPEAIGPLEAHRLLQAIPLERLERLDRSTCHSRHRPHVSRVRVANIRIVEPARGMRASSLANLLRRQPEVAMAYVERAVRSACDTTLCEGLDDHSADQSWLAPAPAGLSARFVWGMSGGLGQEIPFIQVDADWNVEGGEVCHCGLSEGIEVAWGDAGRPNASLQAKRHGMAALGLAVARHDRGGILGLAPEASPVAVCSFTGAPASLTYVPEATQPSEIAPTLINPWNALAVAIDRLAQRAGAVRPVPGVILLELEVEAPPTTVTAWAPPESEPTLRALIGVASALGITVIEAAGNGRRPVTETFLPGSLPTGAAASPVGAILVGGAEANHQPIRQTNTGALIDCFAPGAQVHSLSYSEGSPRTALITNFSGTSSASAIVAGAALVAQGLYHAETLLTLPPESLRQRLRESGTPAKSTTNEDSTEIIGVLPNLARFAELIGLAPVYFRDFPGHNGRWHSEDEGLNSPDILVSAAPPDASTLSELAEYGLPEAETEPATLCPGGVAYITARLSSRGGEALPDFSIQLFAVPADLPLGSLWTPIGEPLVGVLGANGSTVFGPRAWTLPEALEGELWIVALATSGCFPVLIGEPLPSEREDFMAFVRKNPRVTFRRCESKAP